LAGDLERYVEEDSGDGHFSPWGPPLGSLEGGLFTGDFERWMKEGFENGGSLSLWELDEGSLEGGLLYWGP